MLKLKSLFGKRVLGKVSLRSPVTRGATRMSSGRLCHRIHSPAGALSDKCIGGAPSRAFSPRRWEKQHGRTLLEMLGVLAIIGVLFITALVGFTYAMNKHRANETIYDVMLRGTNVPMIDEYYANKPSGHEFRFPGLPGNGKRGTYYPMTTKKDTGSSYYVEATDVTYRVCELILKMNPTDIDQIVVGDTVYTGDSDICGNADGLAMKFCFGSDGAICDGTGGSGSGGTSGGSGSGSGSGEIGTTCDPACGSCEQCVDGTCEVLPCSITSCLEGQQPTGTDDCGCIIGCEDKCPGLSCGTCEVKNEDTCTCDVDPACTCEERGGETIYYLTGGCCELPSTCCDADEGCPKEECTITDAEQCGVLCTEGAQTTSVCCTAVSIDGDDPTNHVWVGDPYSDGYCCASKSESQDCCEAASGKWCDGVCCDGNQTCGNAGQCCTPLDETTCANGIATDENGCPVCKEATCPSETPVSCSVGSDTWCCTEGNTCGETAGECCLGGTCCEGTTYCTLYNNFNGSCGGSYACCEDGGTIYCSMGTPSSTGFVDCGVEELCCPAGGIIYNRDLVPELYLYGNGCCPMGGTVYVRHCAQYTSQEATFEACLSNPLEGEISCCPAGKTIGEPSFAEDLDFRHWTRSCT